MQTLNFWQWKASAGVLYLLSAACLLVGATMVIAPIYSHPELILEQFYLIGTLNLYQGMLLGVAILVCYWKKGNDDAISLSALIGIFLVACSVALDTITLDFPTVTAILGLAGIIFASINFYFLQRYVLGTIEKYFFLPIFLLIITNFLIPACIGFSMRNKMMLRAEMLSQVSLGLTLIAGLRLWFLTYRIPEQKKIPTNSMPFLHTVIMRWVLAIIILAASLIHQYTLRCPCDLAIKFGDILPALGILTLIYLGLAHRMSNINKTIAVIPLLLALCAMFNNSYTLFQELGPAIVCYPPVFLMLMAFALSICAWRYAQKWLYYLSILYVLGAIPFLHATPKMFVSPNYALLAAGLTIFSLFLAIIHKDTRWAILFICFLSIDIVFSPYVARIILYKIPSISALCLLFGTLTLILYMVFPKESSKPIAFLAVFCLSMGILSCFQGENKSLYFPIASAIISLIFFFIVAFRLAAWYLLIPGSIPFLNAAPNCLDAVINFLETFPNIMPQNKGWFIVISSFLILGLGVLSSFIKAKKNPPTQVPNSPIQSDPQQDQSQNGGIHELKNTASL
ncbi:MAG: hypothetical protein HUU50_20940 [Candidatus Brocadiae bacterium]|nr:hypothetical protein [Candidatus Brocadiia bacterium]